MSADKGSMEKAHEKNGDNENEVKKKTKTENTQSLNLITTTETSDFFLSKFNAKDVYQREKVPKNFLELERLLNKILINLDETESVFLNQARAVMNKDLILINWRIRLRTLQKSLKQKKEDFERIDQTVQCIHKLNTHIDTILSKLEKELPGGTIIDNAFKYSPTRMSMYDAMTSINIKQKDMLQQLSGVVLQINDIIECNPADPVDQFTRILSLHTEVLRKIERRTALVEEQIRIIKALHEYYTNREKCSLSDCC